MPTDQRGEMNNDKFVECLKNRPDYVYTQIVLVRDDLKLINNSNLFGTHNFKLYFLLIVSENPSYKFKFF